MVCRWIDEFGRCRLRIQFIPYPRRESKVSFQPRDWCKDKGGYAPVDEISGRPARNRRSASCSLTEKTKTTAGCRGFWICVSKRRG